MTLRHLHTLLWLCVTSTFLSYMVMDTSQLFLILYYIVPVPPDKWLSGIHIYYWDFVLHRHYPHPLWWISANYFNSLAPDRFGCDLKNSIFNLFLLIGILRSLYDNALRWMPQNITDKQRFLTPGHQGWNDLHSLCRIGMEYYLLNNDDNNIIYWIMMIIMIMMMIIIMIIMMTMMIIGTATIMIMIIIIKKTLTMTIMKMIMIKTAQTPCQSLYKDRRI